MLFLLVWDPRFHFLALLTICCFGISYKKILIIYLSAVGAVISTTVITALCDGIINYVRFNGTMVKSSWGICNTTDYASIVFFLLLALWVLLDHIPDAVAFLIPALSFFNAWLIAGSRTSMICSCLLAGFTIVLYLKKNIHSENKALHRIQKFFKTIMEFAFPISAFLCFALTFAYSRGYSFTGAFDRISSNRLTVMLNAFTNNHLSLFGYPISEIGNGSSDFPPLTYTFVDISYVLILLKYGVIIFAIFLFLWPFFTHRAFRNGNKRIAIALFLMAVHSISEHHFPELAYNIYLIMPFCVLKPDTSEKEIKPVDHKNRQYQMIKWGLCVLLAGIEIAFLPRIFSLLRIFASANEDSRRVAGYILAFIVLSVSVILFISYIAASLATRKKVFVRNYILLGCSVAGMITLFLFTNHYVNETMKQQSPILEKEQAAVSEILESKTGKVFAYKKGEIYRRRFPEIDLSILDGNDLARYKNVTVITDRSFESPVFSGKGMRYTPISEEHAVYSNDNSVIDALEKSGLPITSYCTYVHIVDFRDKDQWTENVITDDGSLLLGAESDSLLFDYNYDIKEKKRIDLYAGDYTIIYDLRVAPEPYESDYVVCSLDITDYDGQRPLRHVDVYRSSFDENGDYAANVALSTAGSPDVNLRISVAEGQNVGLKSIQWGRSLK